MLIGTALSVINPDQQGQCGYDAGPGFEHYLKLVYGKAKHPQESKEPEYHSDHPKEAVMNAKVKSHSSAGVRLIKCLPYVPTGEVEIPLRGGDAAMALPPPSPQQIQTEIAEPLTPATSLFYRLLTHPVQGHDLLSRLGR